MVVCCDCTTDDAYVIPYAEVKDLLIPPYLRDSGTRWIGNLYNEYFSISCAPLPKQEIDVCRFHNAFELLQDAPQPLPQKPDISEYY